MLVNNDIEFSSIVKALKNMEIRELIDIFIFDVYEGEHVDSGQKSLALGLIFQDFSRTLEEQEISAHVGKIMKTLENQTGAVLRQ